jgi:hypothetical protein
MSAQPVLPVVHGDALWVRSRDANPTALEIFKRHYSFKQYRDGRRRTQFVGPGGHIVLLTQNADALFVWRKFISGDGQQGVNCSVFRNESLIRSRDLILAAEVFAQERWPGERFYTYVNARKLHVRHWHGTKRVFCPWPPGRVFLEAGWEHVTEKKEGGEIRFVTTKHNRLFILEKLPNG